jgi:hypothetical protein
VPRTAIVDVGRWESWHSARAKRRKRPAFAEPSPSLRSKNVSGLTLTGCS